MFAVELKRVVFGEFVDELKIGEKIANALNISDKNKSEDDSDDLEKIGEERLGPQDVN